MGGILEEFGIMIGLKFDKAAAEEAQSAIKKLGDELRHTAFEAAGAATALFAIGKNFTSNARELEDQAEMLGLNTKQLQEYEYAAKVAADVNREDLVGSLQHLGDMMDRARAGDQDARQALLQLSHAGIGEQAMLQKLNDKTYTSADAMKDLSLGFKNIAAQSPQAAARLAEFAFGSAKLMPLLKQGPEAFDRLAKEADKNFVINDKMIKQGAEMDREFTKVWLTFKKFAYEIGFNVMKHIKPLVIQFEHWFQSNKKVIASGINTFLDKMVDVLIDLGSVFGTIAGYIGSFIDAVGGVKNAVTLLVDAFLLFKGLSFLSSIIGIFVTIAPLIGTIVSALSSMLALKEAFNVFMGLKSLLGLGPAIAGFFGTIGAAMLPWIAGAAAIGAVVVALHDLYEIYQKWKEGGSKMSFGAIGDAIMGADTWTGAGIKKVKGMFGGGSENSATAAVPSVGGSGPEGVTQENHFVTNNNIGVPTGTTAGAAAGMISKATNDSHDHMMRKTKMHGQRKQRN